MSKQEKKIIKHIKIYKTGDEIHALVENTNVFFLLGGTEKQIELYEYYEKNLGKGRYTLASLLTQLMDEKYVYCNTVLEINNPNINQWDGVNSINQLIQIYKDHGFQQYEAEPGKPLVLKSTVGNVLQALKSTKNIVLKI